MANAQPFNLSTQVAKRMDPRDELNKLLRQTKDMSSHAKINWLVYGRMRTGKTQSLAKVRNFPIMHASFDQGGWKSLREVISEDKVIVLDFEYDDPDKPTQYDAFTTLMDQYREAGIFNHIGTFVLDGLTGLGSHAMNKVLKESLGGGDSAGRLWPQRQDYNPQMVLVYRVVQEVLRLPCDTIIMAHEGTDKDDFTGKMFHAPMVTGMLKEKVPAAIDEVYCARIMDVKNSKGEIKAQHVFQVKGSEDFPAGSRLDTKRLLSDFEPQSYVHILNKLGIQSEQRNVFKPDTPA